MAKETIIRELGEGDAEQVRTFDVLSGDDVEGMLDCPGYAYGAFAPDGELLAYCTIGGADCVETEMIEGHPSYDCARRFRKKNPYGEIRRGFLFPMYHPPVHKPFGRIIRAKISIFVHNKDMRIPTRPGREASVRPPGSIRRKDGRHRLHTYRRNGIMRKQLKRIRTLRTIVGITLFLIFFVFLTGTCGSLELDRIGILQAMFQLAVGLAMAGICIKALECLDICEGKLQDAIDEQEMRETRRQEKWDRYFKTGRI